MSEFAKSLEVGERHEAVLDRFFGRCIDIRKASAKGQRFGIDRWFLVDGIWRPVEYKADSRASQTGNAFIETISVDTRQVPGWVYTSKSYYLAYFLPSDLLCYWILFSVLRQQLHTWLAAYPVRKVTNRGYRTHGLLVPLFELEQISQEVISL